MLKRAERAIAGLYRSRDRFMILVGTRRAEAGWVHGRIVPPADGERALTLEAVEPSRVVRVVHGRGHGFIRRAARQ